MNLRDHEMIPFKTKVKLSNGGIWVFIGKPTPSKWRFASQESLNNLQTKSFRSTGEELIGSARSARIVEVGKRWKPAPGSTVWIQGHVAKLGNVKSIVDPIPAHLADEISPGFFSFNSDREPLRGIAHVNTMRKREVAT